MREELISFRLKPSRFIIIFTVTAVTGIATLLFYANIITIAKLIILTIIALIIIINYWKYTRINEVNFLVELNEMIIRSGRTSQLVKVDNLQNLGYLLIKITLILNNKTLPLLIFYDCVDSITYKKLMRLAQWKNYRPNRN